MMADYLFGYKRGAPGIFLLAGFGLGMVSTGWEEKSPNDISLGTPWDGGSMHECSTYIDNHGRYAFLECKKRVIPAI